MAAILSGLIGAIPAPSRPAHAGASPLGLWLTEDQGGVVEIYRCGATLCGRIVGMEDWTLPNGRHPVDSHGRPRCGLTILHDTKPAADGRFLSHITDPENGTDWHCEFWVDASGRLRLRGYVIVPLLGQTQTWTPYQGTVDENCRMTPATQPEP